MQEQVVQASGLSHAPRRCLGIETRSEKEIEPLRSSNGSTGSPVEYEPRERKEGRGRTRVDGSLGFEEGDRALRKHARIAATVLSAVTGTESAPIGSSAIRKKTYEGLVSSSPRTSSGCSRKILPDRLHRHVFAPQATTKELGADSLESGARFCRRK